MKLTIILHILFFAYFTHVCHCVFGKKKNFQLLKYEECSDNPGLPFRVIDFKNHLYSKNNRSVEMIFMVDKELSDISAVTNLWKCDSSGAPDTCEYFVKNLKITKLCEKIPQKNQGWTEFVESFQPALSCPIKKGKYVVKNNLKDDPFKFFPLPLGIWKSKSFMYEHDNNMIACLDFHIKIFETRE